MGAAIFHSTYLLSWMVNRNMSEYYLSRITGKIREMERKKGEREREKGRGEGDRYS